jgi:hypothetical protein
VSIEHHSGRQSRQKSTQSHQNITNTIFGKGAGFFLFLGNYFEKHAERQKMNWKLPSRAFALWQDADELEESAIPQFDFTLLRTGLDSDERETDTPFPIP